MTGEEAIEILERKIATMEDGAICCNYGIDKEVFKMSIEAIKQNMLTKDSFIEAEIER